jgi:putative transposase
MKASKFTDAQKAFIIKQDEDGTPVAEICRKAGISQATNFNWKKKYAGPMPSEMRRLRQTTGRRNASPLPIACDGRSSWPSNARSRWWDWKTCAQRTPTLPACGSTPRCWPRTTCRPWIPRRQALSPGRLNQVALPIWRLAAMAITNISMAVLQGPTLSTPLALLFHRLREPPRMRRAIAHRHLS